MKRGLLVAALVLVPFAVLVGLGFYFTEVADLPLPRDGEQRAPRKPPTPMRVVEDAGVSQATDGGRVLPAFIAPLEPQVHRCFLDNHVFGRIRVRFTPQLDGGFDQILVTGNTKQDPYLQACVEDVLQTAAFQPSPGPAYERVDYTFSF